MFCPSIIISLSFISTDAIKYSERPALTALCGNDERKSLFTLCLDQLINLNMDFAAVLLLLIEMYSS